MLMTYYFVPQQSLGKAFHYLWIWLQFGEARLSKMWTLTMLIVIQIRLPILKHCLLWTSLTMLDSELQEILVKVSKSCCKSKIRSIVFEIINIDLCCNCSMPILPDVKETWPWTTNRTNRQTHGTTTICGTDAQQGIRKTIYYLIVCFGTGIWTMTFVPTL